MSELEQTRVLIVEDDPLVSRMIQGMVEEINLTVVGKAADGRRAVEMTASLKPDVVLMDIEMPDVNGIEAARLILKRCPTPVVVLTAFETPELLAEATAAGVGAYLVKPPSSRELERAISISMARFGDIMSLRRQAAELEALRQASLRLTARLELQSVLQALLEQIHKLVDAHDSHIFFFDGSSISFGAALWADGTQARPYSPPRPEGLTYTVARTGEPIVISNVDGHALFQDWRWGGAIIGLPLRVGDQVIGVMNIAFEEPRAFDQNELRLLELLAAQASIAIHNARLFEQVQNHAAGLEERVAERTHELSLAYARLQELERLKSKFITDISHELRTPATNVRLYLELLERGSPEKQGKYLSVIKEQTDQMVRLVEDILEFSHLELDRTKARFSRVDLNLLTDQLLVSFQPDASAAGLELSFTAAPDLPRVWAEPQQLSKLITKLLDNAITYTSQGFVRVSTGRFPKQDQVFLRVEDTGRGIDAEDLPHLFERFYRGRGVGSSTIAGTGLGLSFVQEIVNLHDGVIRVTSTVGEGSTFTVYLPVESNQ